MIRSCVTVSLVPEARGGPFVFWDDLPAACREAAELGFDAIEIFAPARSGLPSRRSPLARGARAEAGRGRHRRRLGAAQTALLPCRRGGRARRRSNSSARSSTSAGRFGAPAIIGSMQGRWGDGVDEPTARDYLRRRLSTTWGARQTQRRSAAIRTAQPVRDQPRQHRRGGLPAAGSLGTDNVSCWPICFT